MVAWLLLVQKLGEDPPWRSKAAPEPPSSFSRLPTQGRGDCVFLSFAQAPAMAGAERRGAEL
eukprot:3221234-Prorocentrum_lima.AAC.1